MTTTIVTSNNRLTISTTGPALLREISMREALRDVVSICVMSESGVEVIYPPFGQPSIAKENTNHV